MKKKLLAFGIVLSFILAFLGLNKLAEVFPLPLYILLGIIVLAMIYLALLIVYQLVLRILK